MKAIFLEGAGTVDQFQYRDIDEPSPQEHEVLIQVKAIGINPVDIKVRGIEDVMTMFYADIRPIILGWDIAGEVIAVGEKSSRFQKGDKVFGMVNFPKAANAYAEIVASPEDHLTLIPEGMSFEDAAATTLAALTALQAMRGRVKEGNKVLIHAGSGGVGHFAIQIAKHWGAHVTTTCSSKNKDFVMSLGADVHIDYKNQAFETVATDMDFVLDGMSGDVLLNSIKVVKEGGCIISLPSPDFSEEIKTAAETAGVNVEFMLVEADGDDMNTLKGWIEEGVLKPHVSKTFSFDAMSEAHIHVESGRTVGKVVVTLA